MLYFTHPLVTTRSAIRRVGYSAEDTTLWASRDVLYFPPEYKDVAHTPVGKQSSTGLKGIEIRPVLLHVALY